MKKLFFISFFLISFKSYSQLSIDTSITNFIDKWIGKPYKFGGTSESGIDCSALVQKFYDVVFNFEIPRTCFYQFKKSIKISPEEIKVGDVIYFKSSQSPSGWHCGIYIGDNKFFHSSNKKEGVKINLLTEARYINKIKGIGRFIN